MKRLIENGILIFAVLIFIGIIAFSIMTEIGKGIAIWKYIFG